MNVWMLIYFKHVKTKQKKVTLVWQISIIKWKACYYTYSVLQLLHNSLINHFTSTLYLIFGHMGTTLINSCFFLAYFITDCGLFASITHHWYGPLCCEIKFNWTDGNIQYFHSDACFYFEGEHESLQWRLSGRHAVWRQSAQLSSWRRARLSVGLWVPQRGFLFSLPDSEATIRGRWVWESAVTFFTCVSC